IVDIPDPVKARPGKPPLAGFLGAPLMRDAVLCVDYEHGRMQRWPRAAFKGGELATVPMKLQHELPTLQVMIDGQRATLIVDSGNNGAITVYPAFARRTGFRQRYPDLTEQRVNDGSGAASSVFVAEAGVVEFGPGAAFQHVPVAVIAQGMDPAWGIDGMVGYVLLSQLNPCLDRDGERFLFDAE
ncbi:MAG: aspartyl protease family protein, partial [Panacagrimonas sp.]